MTDVIDQLFSVDGKVTVITGGSRGIGKMFAKGFVMAGAKVYIVARKEAAVTATAEELSELGTCIPLTGDLGSKAGADAVAAEIASREPKVDVLINNAGAIWQAPLEDYPDSAWDKLWNINVKGVFYLTVALLPQLRAAASPDSPARVINLGSVDADQVPSWETYAYAASKAGVHMLTRHLGHQLASEHITVNGIVPGPFQSNMTTGVLDTEGPREELLSRVALGREGTWEDAAGVAIFLASRAGSFLTGALIPMDGGMSTHH